MSPSENEPHPPTKATRWRPVIVLLSALVFLWPAVVNGGAFLFPDSVEYIRGPDGALGKLFGPAAKSQWSRPRPAVAGASAPSQQDQALSGTPRSGRSIYYGLLANLGARTGGFWLTLFLQSLAAAFSIDLLCRALGWTRIRTFCLVVALSAFLTPLAIFAGFIMADVFAAVMVTAAAALAAGADRLSRTDIAVAAGLIAYSAATHTSHLAIVLAIIASACLLLVLRRRGAAAARSAAILGAVGVASLAAAVTAGLAFDLAVKKAFGAPPIGVPYLTARMVGDHHPGEAWLRRRCPEAGFMACRFVSRLPMTSNEFLWSITPPKSAFTTASTPDQIALGREQARLLLTIAKEEPWVVGRTFVADWAAQLGSVSLEDMNVTEDQRFYLNLLVPDGFRGVWAQSLAVRRQWPIEPMTLALEALTLASLAAMLGLSVKAVASGPRGPSDEKARLLSATLVVVACVLANAAACGGLSGVFGRYEARILPPFILLGWFAMADLVRSRRREPNIGAGA